MSMVHKAYAFDWSAFERDELHEILLLALVCSDQDELIRYIETQRAYLKDPDQGDPLPENWQSRLENRDVYEYGDFALTRFYEPREDWGLWNQWQAIDGQLPEKNRAVLLGAPFGPAGAYFDPGRLGSFFQTPHQVVESLARIQGFELPDLEKYERESLKRFEGLLEECADKRSGLYVTF
jgi:hypothetical protein